MDGEKTSKGVPAADCGKCIDPAGCADGVCYRAWCAADERRSLGRPPHPGDAELLGCTDEALQRAADPRPGQTPNA